jgi:hypothetical protein
MKLRFALFLLVVLLLITGLPGCASNGLLAMSDEWCAVHPEASPTRCVRDHTFLWDQGHLHSTAAGSGLCPTAIYVAPDGNLALCGPPAAHEMRILTITVTASAPPQPTTFETLNEAAVKALENAYRISHYYEVGGVLTKLGGRYGMGRPGSDVSGDSLSVINMDPLSYHGEIMATYHTHPCNSNTHIPAVFSPTDTHSDRSYKVIGFIADLCTGKVSRYDPAVDTSPDVTSEDGWAGHEVGQFTVDGKVLDEHLREAM